MNIYCLTCLISVWVETEIFSPWPRSATLRLQFIGVWGGNFWNSSISSHTITGFLIGSDLLIFREDFWGASLLLTVLCAPLNFTFGKDRGLSNTISVSLSFLFFVHFLDLKILSSLEVILCCCCWVWVWIMLTSWDSGLSNDTTDTLCLFPAGESDPKTKNDVHITNQNWKPFFKYCTTLSVFNWYQSDRYLALKILNWQSCN